MYSFRRIALATLLGSATAVFPGCSKQELPEPVQPASSQLANASTSNAALIATVRAWFAQAGAPVPVEWAEAQTAGQWVVAPITEVHNPFVGSPYQGLRYVVAKVTGNNACQGRIVEFITPDQRLTRQQAIEALLSGVQPLVASGNPASRLGSFTGALLVYSARYAYQTGMLYQQGTVHPKPARLYIQRRQQTQTAAARSNQQGAEPPVNDLLQVCQTTIVTTGYIQPGSTYTSAVSYEVTTCTVYNDGTSGTSGTPGSTWGGTTDGGSAPNGNDESNPLPFDDRIIEAQLQPCLANVLSEIKCLENGKIADIITLFSGNTPGFNWNIKSGSLSITDAAETSSSYNRKTGTVTTTFNINAFSNASELSVARTIMHESIHAYLVAFFSSDQQMAKKSYPELYDAYVAVQNPSLNTIQHNQIASAWIQQLAYALQQYGESRGYNLTNDFYIKLAWGGLQESSTFKSLTPSMQNDIKNVIIVESSGKDLDGNIATQKGNKAGC